MLELKGNNLPQRQQDLNKLVNEAILNEANFNDIQSFEEHSDVDRLFKIDVASKYKNSEYIIETLKCGDSLYISRALKCEWLYSDDFSHIINPDYLHHNIFPWMSSKMKKKLLTTISCHILNEDRTLQFYKYCKEIKLIDISFKFLIFTSEIHKLEYLQNIDIIDELCLQKFFGNSFKLVETYLGKLRGKQMYTNDKIIKLSYLYSVSNEQYLNLLERYSVEHYNDQRLGLRLSKSIMTKYKERVVKTPTLYIKYLNLNVIVKYSTIEDAKQYIVALLPCEVYNFWSRNFYKTYSKIFDLLPVNERYHFLRQIFLEKYTNEPFEMSKNFYDVKYYDLLTIEERESWALKHLEQKKEFFGSGEDFLWYKFVNFNVAFKEIKQYIYKTVNKYKRGEIVNVLIYSVRNEQQLESLINYYYDRHVNEVEYIKQQFIDELMELHNVFKFNESCWNAFHKILLSMDDFSANYIDNTKACVIIYNIIHGKETPRNLPTNKILGCTIRNCFIPYFKYLTEEQINLIYEYFVNIFCNLIREFDDKDYDNEVNKVGICSIIDTTLEVLIYFKKTKHECPDVIYKYVQLYWDKYKYSELFAEKSKKEQKHTEVSLLRLLKQDVTLLLKTLPDVINSFKNNWEFFPLNNLMKKLRIYFSNNTTNDCVKLFETCLLHESLYLKRCFVYSAISGIFHVANDIYKIDFMTNYAPAESKISHDTIDRNRLKIQEGICRFAYFSRPPVPLPLVLRFIKGDYVHFCLPMLNALVANLPKNLSLQFIAAILDAPVSVQKHGLRLAFKCFSTEDLKQLIVNVWKKSKNVSVRKILYTSLVDYIVSVDLNLQQSFYEVLKLFTMDLNEDDDDEIFNRNCLPNSLKGDFLETAWKTVEKFSEKNSKNIGRKINIIKEIEECINSVNKEFCRVHILDELVDSTSFKKNVEMSDKRAATRLIYQKWILAVKYINHFDTDEEMARSMEFVSIIIKRCIEMSEECIVKFTMYRFLITFLEKVLKTFPIFDDNKDKTAEVFPMLEYIINQLLELMPLNEIYLLYWNYSLTIILIKVIGPKIVNPITGEKSYEHLNTNEIATRFTNELVLFMNCLKEKNILYTRFFDTIADILYDIGWIPQSIRGIGNISLPIINRLTEIQTPETFLLAVMLFTKQFSGRDYSNNLGIIYDKVIKFNNEEVKTVMYENLLEESGKYF